MAPASRMPGEAAEFHQALAVKTYDRRQIYPNRLSQRANSRMAGA